MSMLGIKPGTFISIGQHSTPTLPPQTQTIIIIKTLLENLPQAWAAAKTTVSLQLSVSRLMMEDNVAKSMSVKPSEVRASSAC